VDSRGVSLAIIYEGPTWLTVDSAHAVKQVELPDSACLESSLEAY